MWAEVSREQLGADTVDLAIAGSMLLHQPDPARGCVACATLLRSGGVGHHARAIRLLYRMRPVSEPHVPAMTRVWELVIAAARARVRRRTLDGKGASISRTQASRSESPRYFCALSAGHRLRNPARRAALIAAGARKQDGLATDDEIAQLDRELELAKQRTDVQWVSSPLMFEWIARA